VDTSANNPVRAFMSTYVQLYFNATRTAIATVHQKGPYGTATDASLKTSAEVPI